MDCPLFFVLIYDLSASDTAPADRLFIADRCVEEISCKHIEKTVLCEAGHNID